MTLRIGVMTRGDTVPAWQARCLEELGEVPGVELAAVIVDPTRSERSRSPRDRIRRLFGSRNRLWKAYNNLHVARRSRALQPVLMEAFFTGVERFECRTRRDGHSEYFEDADLARIAALELDVILRFAYGIIRGPILSIPRFGVWSFHHDDEQRYRGGPPCFWEMYHGDPITGSILQRLTERLDGGVVLRRGFFPTRHSYVRNTDEAHFGSGSWPAAVCRQILAGDTASLGGPPSPSDAPLFRPPTDRQMAVFLVRAALRFLSHHVRSVLFADQWNVGVVDEPIERFADPEFEPRIRWLPRTTPRSEYVADPFPVPGSSPPVAVVEHYDYQAGRGSLAVLDLTGDGDTGGDLRPVDGFDGIRHLSYPFVLDCGEGDEGGVFCVPETARERRVDLYRLDGSPDRWVRAATLLENVEALDPTVFHHGGRWWLSYADRQTGPNTTLHLWWAERLSGPWHAHVANPVKVDVRSSRPAGTPFVVDGVLYRPAQDCSREYGGAAVVNRVDELTPDRFSEVPVRAVEPDRGGPYGRGLHTLAAMGPRTLVDGKRRIFCWPAAVSEVRGRLGRVSRGAGESERP